MVYNNILETIGRTPMVRLNRLPLTGSAMIYCKLESFNPMRSVKDRVALAMIEDAEAKGKLKPGMEVVVVEPTSGNTGIGLAMVCAVKGYKLILTMPENFSIERRKLLSALGAELVLTPRLEGMQGAVDCAKGLCKERTNTFMPQQFDNPANPESRDLHHPPEPGQSEGAHGDHGSGDTKRCSESGCLRGGCWDRGHNHRCGQNVPRP